MNHKIQSEQVITILLGFSVLMYIVSILLHIFGFTTDDAFISWHYARSLLEGHGLRWNIAEPPVEGYSNFLWVMIAALVLKLGLPVVTAMKGIAVCCLGFGLYSLYRLARIFLLPLEAMLPVYIVSHYQGLLWWTVSGLETSLFVALAVWASWQALCALGYRNVEKNSSVLTGINHLACFKAAFGLTLLALTRFDGIIWALSFLGFLGCTLRTVKSYRLFPWKMSLSLVFLGFILPYGSYFIWRFTYFLKLLPNSYACKMAISSHAFHLVFNYLPIFFPCVAVGLPALLYLRDCRFVLLCGPSLLYILLLWRADPVVGEYNRHFLAVWCLLSLIPVLGLQTFANFLNIQARTKRFLTVGLTLVFTHFLIQTHSIEAFKLEVKHYQQRAEMRKKVANYLNERVQKNGSVLLADCGVIPYYARPDMVLIDSQGLNNQTLTSVAMRPLHRYANYLQATIKPDWIVRSYYPKWQRGNDITEILQKNNFFDDYQLVKTFQAHRFILKQHQVFEKEPDFVYKIYEKRSGRPIS